METIGSPKEKGTTMEWIVMFDVLMVLGAFGLVAMAQAEIDYYDE